MEPISTHRTKSRARCRSQVPIEQLEQAPELKKTGGRCTNHYKASMQHRFSLSAR